MTRTKQQICFVLVTSSKFQRSVKKFCTRDFSAALKNPAPQGKGRDKNIHLQSKMYIRSSPLLRSLCLR